MKRRLLFLLMVLILCITTLASAQSDSPYEIQVVRQPATLMIRDTEVGMVEFWNTRNNFMTEFNVEGNWYIKSVQIYVGEEPPTTYRRLDRPITSKFPCKERFRKLQQNVMVSCDLEEEFDHTWGGDQTRYVAIQAYAVKLNSRGRITNVGAIWAYYEPTDLTWQHSRWGHYFTTTFVHPKRGHFIDSPVGGITYKTPTNWGTTDESGAFDYFPGEKVDLSVGSLYLGQSSTDLKISPLDIFMTDVSDPQVTNMARLLQTLDADGDPKQGIDIKPSVTGCLDMALGELGLTTVDFADDAMVQAVIDETLYYCQGNPEVSLVEVSAEEAQANLEDGISESGIYRKNISKTEEWGEDNQKLEVMPVYFPGVKSNGDPSYCDLNDNNLFDEGEEGVPYEEWRLNGEVDGETCDPREDGDACQVTLIECREVAKPIIVTYLQQVDIFAENVTTEFYPDRFSNDVFTAISRDDGATWKRMNVSRMADLTSFTLETGEPFPGTTRSPQMKIIDNNILVVWTSTYARGGNPRYAITTCDDPLTSEVETPETGCQMICRGDPEQGTEVCEPDYPYDDEYAVTDIWGVRGQQQSVNYDEVDDVAELGIGEIPYSALWAARGVIVTQAELDAGTFDSIDVDDPETPEDESLVVGDIVWYKPERLTSARRDSYIPVVAGTRGAGFVIAWQADPEGLRPGKGKGPGQGWSGAISNHKTDIWYSFIRIDDFNMVDENFVPGGEPDEDRPGLGRPKALVPFTLPVRISDNDMVNTDTLKVELDGNGLPIVTDGTYTPLDPEDVEHGNAVGTKRYSYMANDIDDNNDGVPDYQYYVDRGGTLNLCDTSEGQDLNNLMTSLPGTAAHERWYRFTNTEGSEKTVCVTEDGRLLDGDVSASRPNISLQPYTRADGTKSAWVLLAYEESKGMGHPHAEDTSGGGQVPQPIRQDYGKDVIYHTFDFTEPDLVAPGHVVNLPALGGGLYLNYCENLGFAEWDPSYDRICTAEGGEPIPLYFEEQTGDGSFILTDDFVQYRTEIARRTRFIAQSYSKLGDTRLAAAIIYKQGQEGQGRPADVFIRRIVVPEGINPQVDNPFAFENFECNNYLDESFPDLPGYNHNVWGEEFGDRLCGGIDFSGDYPKRDHINLTSADIDLSVDAGPDDDTPDDPTDDVYGTDKVLLWSMYDYNLGDESYGYYNGEDGFSGMFSNARSHRGFIRGDFLVTAYAYSPNWSAARNGRDRYNFYLRKSFDGGQTWTTTPADMGGVGVNYCQEWRTDPVTHEAPIVEGFDPECVDWCAEGDTTCTVTGVPIGAGEFQPAIKVSSFDNNKETSSDPRVGATPPQPPLDGRVGSLPVLRFVEDYYVDNIFFVAWGAGDNAKSTGGQTVTPEAPPTDIYYTRSTDYGDTFLKMPWNVNPQDNSDNYEQGELVWKYDWLAHGDPEQGECQLRATPDGSKMYSIYHQLTPGEEDPDEPITRWYPWEPEESHDNDVWFRRVIFWD